MVIQIDLYTPSFRNDEAPFWWFGKDRGNGAKNKKGVKYNNNILFKRPILFLYNFLKIVK